MRYRLVISVLCPLLAVAGGCSKGPSVSTIPVTGKITYNGAPLADATVTFVNADPDGRSASAVSGADGTFKLQTFVTPAVSKDGAVAGDYTVTVVKTERTAPSDMTNMSMEQMKEFGTRTQPKKRDTTSTNTQVESGPPPPKSLVPEKYASPKTSGLNFTVSPTSHEFTLDLKD